jgi:hypothetical protein
MNFARTLGYIAMWSVGFIAVKTVVAKPMQAVQDFIAGNTNSGNGGL